MLYYRIRDDKLYDNSDYQYDKDCLTTDIITFEDLKAHPNKVIVGDVEVKIDIADYDDEGNPTGTTHKEIQTVRGLVLNPDYEQEEAAKERKRLDSLTLTPADVERSLYKAKGMDFEDLKTLIAEKIPQVDIKGLSIEFRAKDFYRGATADGLRLFDVVGQLLGYSSEDMDYLFQNKELPVKEESEVTE